jgi:phospholipid/cholesterol/gamma-HCH transport system substrate-binding protein
MSSKRLEWRVGLFVAMGLVFAAVLVMRFSKGGGLFTPTYTITLQANNVGGIIPGAGVVLSGVPIGNIVGIDLRQEGRTVLMHARIQKQFQIRKDAVFAIRSASFLGDKYISVTPPPPNPTKKNPGVLKDDDFVQCEEAFDFMEVARSASGLMQRAEQAIAQLTTAVARIDTNVLSVETLTNLTATLSNFRVLSERALVAVDNVDAFVRTNTPALSTTLTNFGLFTDKLNKVTFALQETLATNQNQIYSAIQNVDSATEKLNSLLADVQHGKGLAGALLSNPEMANHVSIIASNFAVLSSNINHKGLWGVVRKPKTKKEE